MPVSVRRSVELQQPIAPALILRSSGAGVELLDRACLACGPCRKGAPDHCLVPGEPVTVVAWSTESEEQPDLAAWAMVLRAVDQLSEVGLAFPRIALIGAGPGLDLLRDCLERGGMDPRVAVPTADPSREEVRRISGELRRGGTGASRPPDVVVAVDGDLSLAARLVRRGGLLASPVPVKVPVPMAALVQRELTVVPHRHVAGTAATAPCLGVIGSWSRRETAA
jgi:hypothetical protein